MPRFWRRVKEAQPPAVPESLRMLRVGRFISGPAGSNRLNSKSRDTGKPSKRLKPQQQKYSLSRGYRDSAANCGLESHNISPFFSPTSSCCFISGHSSEEKRLFMTRRPQKHGPFVIRLKTVGLILFLLWLTFPLWVLVRNSY